MHVVLGLRETRVLTYLKTFQDMDPLRQPTVKQPMDNLSMDSKPMANRAMDNLSMDNQPMAIRAMVKRPTGNLAMVNLAMVNRAMDNRAMDNRAMVNLLMDKAGRHKVGKTKMGYGQKLVFRNAFKMVATFFQAWTHVEVSVRSL